MCKFYFSCLKKMTKVGLQIETEFKCLAPCKNEFTTFKQCASLF